MPSRILFLGGTGTISRACAIAADAAGYDVTIVTRGIRERPLPTSIRQIVGDVRNGDDLHRIFVEHRFDIVADFLSYTPEQVEVTLAAIGERVDQYIFVSSASAYEKPPTRLPITESTPLRNPFWQYSRDKIECEKLLFSEHADHGLPVTVVRPSHTYDETSIPTLGQWTDIARMRAGKPVVVQDDGTSHWTLTHAEDFAVAFVGLIDNPAAVGEAFTVTGAHAPTWNRIYLSMATAAGVHDATFVHIPSETIGACAPELLPRLLGDRSYSAIFDCTKIERFVPGFRTTVTVEEGAFRIMEYWDAHPELQRIDDRLDALFDEMIRARH